MIEAIRLRLVEVLELDDHFVRTVASDQYRYSQEETLIALRPLGPRPATDAGGGRGARPFHRAVRVYISKRSSLDFVGDDRLVVAALFALEDSVYNGLDDHFPLDDDGEVTTLEPLHPTDASGGPPTRKPQEDLGEVVTRLDFEVCYLQVSETPAP